MSTVEVQAGWGGVTWNTTFLTKFATLLAKHSILLQPSDKSPSCASNTKQRRRAALTVARALAPPLLTVPQLIRNVQKFKEICLTERAEGHAPAWLELVEQHLPRVEVGVEVAEGVLRTLTERARALRTADPRVVCRALDVAPHAEPRHLRAVWDRMVAAARAKLDALVSGGDSEAGLQVGARLSRAEWRLVDALLLFDDTDTLRLVREEHAVRAEPLRALVAVFHLVQLYRLEEEGVWGEGDAERRAGWRAAAAAYRRRGRLASAVMLQRRWHDLKLQTRSRLAAVTRKDTSTLAPAPLHLAVARRFSHVVLEPLVSWARLVRDRRLLEECDLTADMNSLNGLPESAPEPMEWPRVEPPAPPPPPPAGTVADAEDDLILVEREIETVDLLAADDTDDSENDTESGEEGRVVIKRERNASPEQARELLRARRREMALALERELDRQLRDLDGGPPSPPPPLPPVPPELPVIIFDSDESSSDTEQTNGRSTGPQMPQHEVHDCDVDESRDEVMSKGEEDDDDEPNIDPKLLMTTSVPLMRVDAEGWREVVPLRPRAAPPTGLAFTPRELVDELLGGSEGGIRIVSVKTEEEGGRRGRIRLPDIAEVRRNHRGVNTAQVAPLAPPGTGTASRRSSDEGELYIDELGAGVSAGTEEGGVLTSVELKRVLRGIGTRSRGLVPACAGSRWRELYCCAARYHRALNDARRRCAVRAGRLPPPDAPVHAARCEPPPDRRSTDGCGCCCAHLLDAEGAARMLVADHARLLDDVRAILAGTYTAPPTSTPATSTPAATDSLIEPESAVPPVPLKKAKTRPKVKRDRTPRGIYAEEPPVAAEDPLQEWIRQKNLTSRFFDLNLKKPPPKTQKAAPLVTPLSSSSQPTQILSQPTLTLSQQPLLTLSQQHPLTSSQLLVTPSQFLITPSQLPVTGPSQLPVNPSQFLFTPSQLPVTPSQLSDTPSQLPLTSQASATPIITPILTLQNDSPKQKQVKKFKVTIRTGSGATDNRNLLLSEVEMIETGGLKTVKRMAMIEYLQQMAKKARLEAEAGAGGETAMTLPPGAIPVTMLQTADGMRLVPVAMTRAPVPASDDVIDLCDEESPSSPVVPVPPSRARLAPVPSQPAPPRPTPWQPATPVVSALRPVAPVVTLPRPTPPVATPPRLTSPVATPARAAPPRPTPMTTSPSQALLSKLPAGISVKRREPTPAPAPDPKAQKILNNLPPGIQVKRRVIPVPAAGSSMVLLNDKMCAAPTPATVPTSIPSLTATAAPPAVMQLSPLKNNSNIKVFKISDEGILTPTDAPAIAATKKSTKLVLVPSKGVAAGAGAEAVMAAGGAPPKLLNSVLARCTVDQNNTKLNIAEFRTSDGKRLLMMRPPTDGQPLQMSAEEQQTMMPLNIMALANSGQLAPAPLPPAQAPQLMLSLATSTATSNLSIGDTSPMLTPLSSAPLYTAGSSLPPPGSFLPASSVSMLTPVSMISTIVSTSEIFTSSANNTTPAKVVKTITPRVDYGNKILTAQVVLPKPTMTPQAKSVKVGISVLKPYALKKPLSKGSSEEVVELATPLESVCTFETNSGAEPAPAKQEPPEPEAEVLELQGGAVVCRAPTNQDFSDLTITVEEWNARGGAPLVQVVERGTPPYKAGPFYVRTSRPLPFTRASVWTPGPESGCARLLLDSVPSVRQTERAYFLCLGVGVIVRAEWVCRSAHDVAREARSSADLVAVHAPTGHAQPLYCVRPPRPGLLALRCKFLTAAQQINKDVNQLSVQTCVKPVSKQKYVNIAPRPPPSSQAPPTPQQSPAISRHVTIKKISAGQSLLKPVVRDESPEKPNPRTSPARSLSPPARSPTPPARSPTPPERFPTPPARSPSPPARPETPPEPRRSSRRAAHNARAKLNDMIKDSSGHGNKKDSVREGEGAGSGDEGLDFSTAAGLEPADSDEDYDAVDDLRRERGARRGKGRGRRYLAPRMRQKSLDSGGDEPDFHVDEDLLCKETLDEEEDQAAGQKTDGILPEERAAEQETNGDEGKEESDGGDDMELDEDLGGGIIT